MRDTYGAVYPRAVDVLVVGAGLAGCLAAVAAKEAGLETLVLTKVHPLRSHSCAAQGGINAAIYEADTSGHADDTMAGSDWLADRNAVELLCAEAPRVVANLDAAGALFSRTSEGRIAQRAFGGQGKLRTCYAKDRTGLVCLQTAFEKACRLGVKFLEEWYVLDLLYDRREGRAYGVVAYDIWNSKPVVFNAKAVILATGGYGRAFKRNSNAHANTGDALSIVLRKGLPLEDMEFVQFHPTGLAGSGILISEAARGEGGYLINSEGKRFMKEYEPNRMELAPRDIVSRAIQSEILAGRGVGPKKDSIFLDVSQLGAAYVQQKLPELRELALCFQNEDLCQGPVRIAPTAHYSMGGIPVDLDGRVRKNANEFVHGLYAAGECACVSVHGANRLGGNSLLEAVIFGERTGLAAARWVKDIELRPAYSRDSSQAKDELSALYNSSGMESLGQLRTRLQETMTKNVGLFRDKAGLELQKWNLARLKKRWAKLRLCDCSRRFNTEMQEILELGHMIDYSRAIVAGALAREESRGAHYRLDFPKRDDTVWLRHSLIYMDHDELSLDYLPVFSSKTTMEIRETSRVRKST